MEGGSRDSGNACYVAAAAAAAMEGEEGGGEGEGSGEEEGGRGEAKRKGEGGEREGEGAVRGRGRGAGDLLTSGVTWSGLSSLKRLLLRSLRGHMYRHLTSAEDEEEGDGGGAQGSGGVWDHEGSLPSLERHERQMRGGGGGGSAAAAADLGLSAALPCGPAAAPRSRP